MSDSVCDFANTAKTFIDTLPYRQNPFSGRNWGHPWHSLCSYHGKLKPSIAYFLIKDFTNVGDTVLDPLGGVGTIPLEACLQGRVGISNDLSELAYIVSKAKIEKPDSASVHRVLNDLRLYIENNCTSTAINQLVEKYQDFGYNGKLSKYFHEKTFREILCARAFFVSKLHNISAAEAMVFSCLLHVLHGNRPYALSRNSHPLTPYAPKGDYKYKNVCDHIANKIALSYKRGDFGDYVPGESWCGDYSDIVKRRSGFADVIICSPPFADSIRFYMQNWMRLWLCGWEKEDYKVADTRFLDQKQNKDFDIYESFFEMCNLALKSKGRVILHLGKTQKVDMAEELSLRAAPLFQEVYRGEEDVCSIEKHGIKDKGSTVRHQYLFLVKRT